MVNILILADLASDAVNNIVGFAGTAPNGVVIPTCNWASGPA